MWLSKPSVMWLSKPSLVFVTAAVKFIYLSLFHAVANIPFALFHAVANIPFVSLPLTLIVLIVLSLLLISTVVRFIYLSLQIPIASAGILTIYGSPYLLQLYCPPTCGCQSPVSSLILITTVVKSAKHGQKNMWLSKPSAILFTTTVKFIRSYT